MERPSDLIWKYLAKTNQISRGEAIETFSYAIDSLIKDNSSGNGMKCDVLESVINNYFSIEDIEKIVKQWEEEEQGVA